MSWHKNDHMPVISGGQKLQISHACVPMTKFASPEKWIQWDEYLVIVHCHWAEMTENPSYAISEFVSFMVTKLLHTINILVINMACISIFQMSSLRDVFMQKSSEPYTKPLKVKVVASNQPQSYCNSAGEEKRSLHCSFWQCQSGEAHCIWRGLVLQIQREQHNSAKRCNKETGRVCDDLGSYQGHKSVLVHKYGHHQWERRKGSAEPPSSASSASHGSLKLSPEKQIYCCRDSGSSKFLNFLCKVWTNN